jgi:UDP-glucose 4-epimerase
MTAYAGLDVVVTGGLGFIGSNLSIRLVESGARVTIIDSIVPGCGGNPHNIASIASDVRVIDADIADAHLFRDELRKASVIFNLAGEISHVHSMQYPERDLQLNTVSQLRFLMACQECARHARIVYASTRQVYGPPKYLPVDEGHPIRPVDFNGVHKFAATSYHLMLTRAGYLDAVVLRLTNVYGPRMALDAVCQGFLSTFIRRMVLREQIEIFGDGKQKRDPMYVDDAVNAFLLAGAIQRPTARCYNAGGSEPLSLAEIAQTASQLAGCPAPVFRPFPSDRKPIDIGSYWTDNRRISRDLRWAPRVPFEEGLRKALDFYRTELPNYLPNGEANPPCKMPEHGEDRYHLEYIKVAETGK